MLVLETGNSQVHLQLMKIGHPVVSCGEFVIIFLENVIILSLLEMHRMSTNPTLLNCIKKKKSRTVIGSRQSTFSVFYSRFNRTCVYVTQISIFT